MIDVLFGIIAIVALGIAVVAFLRERSLRESLQDVQRRVYLAQARLHELENTVQQGFQSLRADVRRQSGATAFAPEMKIADAIAIDPRARDVLGQFHLGGCSACAINEEDTIEHAAMSYGVKVEQLMAALEALSNGDVLPPRGPRHSGLLQLEKF